FSTFSNPTTGGINSNGASNFSPQCITRCISTSGAIIGGGWRLVAAVFIPPHFRIHLPLTTQHHSHTILPLRTSDSTETKTGTSKASKDRFKRSNFFPKIWKCPNIRKA
ncbi:unnamed protein product, partial [Ectocarpus sp. 12 AP-2014]